MNFIGRETWVGVFDILGFKNEMKKIKEDFDRAQFIEKIENLLSELQSDAMRIGKLDYIAFSDTFVIFTQDMKISSYPWFLHQCEQFIENSIYAQLPVRGAISVGNAYVNNHPAIVIGAPFIEAYEYAEDQDWIGLLLTPVAVEHIRQNDLEPLHHDFVADELPLRNMIKENVLAYRFQNGSANFPSPLISYLQIMKDSAPSYAKQKYDNTIEFINRNYQVIQ